VFIGDKQLPFKNGVLTLSEKNCPALQEKLDFFLDQKLKWGLKYFELKDDEISESFLKKILSKIPIEQILFSFRNVGSPLFPKFLNQRDIQKTAMDWPFEWKGEYAIKSHKNISWIYSLHERGSHSLSELLDRFSKKKSARLKLAVEIFSFEELWQGHLWQKEDPIYRSFHPRSKDGRWKWYRLLFGPHQSLYFIREDDEDGVQDQPVMAESVRCHQKNLENGFACVLGAPVKHSATPFEQHTFFKQYKLPVVPILMEEGEVTDRNIKILEDLGMKFSAITSPLKKSFYHLCHANIKKTSKAGLKISEKNSPVSALNTLILKKHGWRGFNTDIDGALALQKRIHQMGLSKVAVWGGGGVRYVLDFIFGGTDDCSVLNEKVFNKFINKLKLNNGKRVVNHRYISFYSARTGKRLKGMEYNPDVVIWAVGRPRMSECLYPPSYWAPDCVFDLNYTDDSPGRGYALKTKSRYISGWLWFKVQAQAQRVLFKKLISGDFPL